MQAAVDRSLKLLARPDLLALLPPASPEGHSLHVVSDPLTHQHYELSAEEYFIFQQLAKPVSLKQISERFNERFAPRRLSAEQASQFVTQLHTMGLLIGDQQGQGTQLLQRDQKRRRSEYAWAWTRLLAIRLPAFNPDQFLTRLHKIIKPLLGWPAILASLLIGFYAIVTLVARYREFIAELPTLASLVQPSSLLGLAAATILLKTLHELGHGLACKHFGGHVPRMGVMLLALAPCLYCDVSDLWRLPSKRQRLVVNAAGMLVELLLAAIAVLVWRHTEPGLLHTLAINVVIVGSISTLLINANPLMRYDGYYLLSDATATPNLWQRSRDAMTSRIKQAFFEDPQPEKATSQEPIWMAIYGFLSQLYLLLVITTVAWLLVATLKPLGLAVLGYGLGLVAMMSLFAGPIRQLTQWLRRPAPLQHLKPYRSLLTTLGCLALLFGLWHTPWTYTVSGQATTVLDAPQHVVATLAGRLESVLPIGTEVEPGDIIAQLENPELKWQYTKLQNELKQQRLNISHLETMRGRDPSASQSLPAAKARREQLERQLKELEVNQQRLVLKAKRAGRVLSPANKLIDESASFATLPNWTGRLLNPENRGAWVEPGETIARVGSDTQLATEMLLSEQDVERIQQGQSVRLAFDQIRGQAAPIILSGQVTEIADRPTLPSPGERVHAPQLSMLQPPTFSPEKMYRVRIAFDETTAVLLDGAAGRAKINTGTEALGQVILSGLRQTFRID